MLPNGRLLTVADVAELLAIEATTVREWVRLGRLPQPLRFTDRTMRFHPEQLSNWLTGFGVPASQHPATSGLSEL
ncbi:MAG: helix-turn-helix transcriptional regulator [Pirellulaceae bacterium]